MSYRDADPYSNPPPLEPPPTLHLPLSKPFFTYALLAAIVIVWLMMTLAGGTTNPQVLVTYGANYGPGILDGQIWRLFTSMFIHIGGLHLLVNAYALFIFGLEMERLYSPDRFLIIYILSGLFGSLASFASKGPAVLSAGASGAIFGIIGMNLAFFLLHRDDLGRISQARIQGTLVIIAINLAFGFLVPGIDNMAHIGGLVAGYLLGYGLAPKYEVVNQYTSDARVVDTRSLLNRWWIPALAVVLLATGIPLSILYWQG
ncbi:MAG: rhomboid family intramembrane serine protease [Anaerolineaceae bacterium]|nr:rhomboid family intramembrane serine protease [Anaerolineaceae bacterium]MCB9101323.1 rhomboid family intramembrane serine protease [Anaerolineales bacterium]